MALVSILRLQKTKHDNTKARDADRARARTVQPDDIDFDEITRQHRVCLFLFRCNSRFNASLLRSENQTTSMSIANASLFVPQMTKKPTTNGLKPNEPASPRGTTGTIAPAYIIHLCL